jgi:hypothetical protein
MFDFFCLYNRHFTLLLTTARYALAVVKFATATKVATISYRLGFLSAVVTYGIVVYKAYRPRVMSGQMPKGQQGILKILGDENVQYLCVFYPSRFFFCLPAPVSSRGQTCGYVADEFITQSWP